MTCPNKSPTLPLLKPQRESASPGDLEQSHERLGGARGKEYWRSLEELADSEEFRKHLEREFPQMASAWEGALSRRRFLSLMGASLALAGVTGCAQQAPRGHIVPYVRQPEEIVPGRPLYFATAMPLAGFANGGLLVESHLGRPTKVEGNPLHPGSPKPDGSPTHAQFGPSDLFAQASILSLYDPDRARAVTHLGDIDSWENFVTALTEQLQRLPEGDGFCVLTETITSPTLAHQLHRLLERYPRARWYVHEPVGQDNARRGAIHAFGRPLQPQYHFAEAQVILSLDADFLACGAGHLRHARDFASRRHIEAGQNRRTLNRLYVAECTPSITGAKADHRLPLRASQIESFARAVAEGLGVSVGPASKAPEHGVRREWIQALVGDLARHRRRSLVIAGESQPAYVHALAHALNAALENTGRTVTYTDPVEARPSGNDTTPAALVRRMQADQVRVLLMLGGNPAYSAGADVPFADALTRVPFRAHLSLSQDETSILCHWHVNEAHYLESWGDVRAADGTVSILQPLIAPLYNGRSAGEVLAVLTGQSERRPDEIVRAYWRNQGLPGGDDFERAWRRALHDGLVEGTRLPPRDVRVQDAWITAPRTSAAGGDLEVAFRPDPTVFDGSFANNGWLQELPKPLSKLTWDNAAYMSPAQAVRLGLAASVEEAHNANGQVVELSSHGKRVEAPVWVLPGHADGAITVHLGYGRTRAGRVGSGIGFSAYALRRAEAPWFDTGLTVRPLNRRHALAATQLHHLMEGRDLVRAGTVQEPPRVPQAANRPRETISLYPTHPADQHKWGMAIDLTACTGCGACVVACQSENNIPIVGKEQVARGREMHWLRIDSYYKGSADNPETYMQPVPCMHCENAPCELVCPVGATVHSSDGLNDMVYNRCVGTRYCSNNCPYKVRRFNFLDYADFTTPSRQLGYNPDVTVRSRGVMEKCTYCVQRIRRTQIDAQLDGNRAIRDGEIQTACQAACPAGAIVFGNLNQRDAQVTRLQADPLNYGLLHDLNTRPRTTYLAALKNPNPEIPPEWRA